MIHDQTILVTGCGRICFRGLASLRDENRHHLTYIST